MIDCTELGQCLTCIGDNTQRVERADIIAILKLMWVENVWSAVEYDGDLRAMPHAGLAGGLFMYN